MERRASFGWSSTSPAGYATPTLGLVCHYDGSNQGLASKPHSACRAYWKRTRNFHTGPSRNWADLGYSYGCCPHGIILEGRGLHRVQAAQPGGNATWYSVTFMGGPSERPTAAQLTAFRQLRAYLMGRGVRGTVSYHGRFISTSCAGTIINTMVSTGAILKGETGGSNPPPSGGQRVLREGATGADVTAVQAQLVYLGYDVGSYGADGRFGPDTTKAVRAFQRAEGIGIDGAIGSETRAALDAAVERERDDVPERTSYTMSSDYRQVIAPDEWTTVRWDRRWDGGKWLDKKAEPSIVFGPALFSSTVGLRAEGLEQGGELQVRYAFYRQAAGGGWERYATMPINSPVHDLGSLHSITPWAGQVSGSKKGRVRVEVNHFRRDGEEVALTGGRVDSLYWKV